MSSDEKKHREKKHHGVGGLFETVAEFGGKLVESVVEVVERLEGFTDSDAVDEAKASGFDHDFIAPLGMYAGVPWKHLPSLEWLVMVGKVGAKLHKNQGANEHLDERLKKHAVVVLGKRMADGEDLDLNHEMRAAVKRIPRDQHHIWFRDLVQSLRPRMPLGRPGELAGYEALFRTIPLPEVAQTFQEDRSFADRRVAGPNPTSLQRVVGELPANFPLTEAQFAGVLQGESLAASITAGRLYLLDYGGLQPSLAGTYPGVKKHVYEPIALFAVQQGALTPVAIQSGQDPARHPLVFASDGPAWKIAKTTVDVADGNFHELVVHLGRTHLLIEPFPVVTERKLSRGHPLRTLLDAHFEGTLFINWAAGDFLVAPKNAVDELLAGTIDADRATSVRVTTARSLPEFFLPTWLKAQGLDDAEKLPFYPFRDDALKLWGAIETWMTEYVELCWPGDGDIIADGELQEWSRELASFEGGRVAGFGDGPGNTIVTRTYLASALTLVVFTGSAMHAAVNFPQRTVMSYPPAMPLAGYRAAPGPGETVTEADWLATLPPLDQALVQVNILSLLGGVYYTQLGHYREGTFEDAAVLAAAARFRARLDEIEAEIHAANREGLRADEPYEHLLPSRIPQSINI